MHVPYEMPQENGNRADTTCVALHDEQGYGFKVRMLDLEQGGVSPAKAPVTNLFSVSIMQGTDVATTVSNSH